MAKVALLIGTGEYTHGLAALPAAPRDVRALEDVLRDPLLGNFDDVTCSINPTRDQMAGIIENWFRQRTKDDLALLFISGHGVKGRKPSELHFAACNTRIEQGDLLTYTSVPAHFVYDRLCESKAKRQVLILDCCFSGAFGNVIPRHDSKVGLEEIFRQEEGQVVLTSSNSIQYSFEQRDGELSIYTSYLVQGIKTGAADLDGNGSITVSELHKYVSREVKKSSPAMTPKIIVFRDEGNLIEIAKAPAGDSSLTYFRKVSELAEEDGGEISADSQLILDELQQQYGISVEEAQKIKLEVQHTYEERNRKLQRYEQVFLSYIERQYPLSRRDRKRLIELQKLLLLRNKDVNPIKRKIMWRYLITGKLIVSFMRGLQNLKRLSLFVVTLIALIGGIFLAWQLLKPPETFIDIATKYSKEMPTGSVWKYFGPPSWEGAEQSLREFIKKEIPNFKIEELQDNGILNRNTEDVIGLLIEKKISFALTSRKHSEKENEEARKRGFTLDSKYVFDDVLAAIVHPNSEIQGLTEEQLLKIYLGEATNWQEFAGSNLSIKPYLNLGGGTSDILREALQEQRKALSGSITDEPSPTKAAKNIGILANPKEPKDRGGIYVGSISNFIKQCTTKILKLGNARDQLVAPYEEPNQCPNRHNEVDLKLREKQYPKRFIRPMFVVVRNDDSNDARAGYFYAKLLLTEQGKTLLRASGYLPLRGK